MKIKRFKSSASAKKMKKKVSVLLASMPWAPLNEPSLGLGILAAALNKDGIACKVSHLSIQLLRYLKASTYIGVASQFALNDYIFTAKIDTDAPSPLQKEIIKYWAHSNTKMDQGEYKPPTSEKKFSAYLARLRQEAIPHFLDDCLDEVLRSNADVIGFSCMYDQTISSLALAHMIKAADPSKFIVLGGYALAYPTGHKLMSSFRCIDAVCYGDGEDRISAIARYAHRPDRLSKITGISYRDARGRVRYNPNNGKRVLLDQSPTPDYSHFFYDLKTLKDRDDITIEPNAFPVESSRGCWWGQKHHCKFCGINDPDLAYRSKSPRTVINMLDELNDHHQIKHFRFSDYILPYHYYKDLLPLLKSHSRTYHLHWEIKSNVDLKKIQTLKDAGVNEVQPGIESFSTSLLKKMSKGVTGIQNVYALKMLNQHNIRVFYNMLFGFPDEETSDYLDQCNLIPLLHHLQPPTSYQKISITRFSPIFQRYNTETKLKATHNYNLVFSEQYLKEIHFSVDDYAYHFQRPYKLKDQLQTLYGILTHRFVNWCRIAESRPVMLHFESQQDGIHFFDSRLKPKGERYNLGVIDKDIYLAIGDELYTKDKLKNELSHRYATNDIDERLNELIALGLIYREDTRIINLAFPASFYAQNGEAGTHTKK
jgi:ribosomal peptide maturation radical SAM protein 1